MRKRQKEDAENPNTPRYENLKPSRKVIDRQKERKAKKNGRQRCLDDTKSEREISEEEPRKDH